MNYHFPISDIFPEIVNAIVEIPQDTHNKYEYDEVLDIIKLDRVIHSPMHYPVDYGFIPMTRSLDGDHLDIMIMTNSPTFTGCLVEARPIGVLIMKDEAGEDEKILAVPLKNPQYDQIKELKDVAPHFLDELVHFFQEYKRLEGDKSAVIKGWKPALDAFKIIRDSHDRYRETGQKTNL